MMNRVDLVLKETGQLLSLNMDFKFIMYISNAVDQRVKKRQEINSYKRAT